ncbi:ABC transporter permease [Arcicella rosea]|uniref:Membrane protein YdbS with pleckstrin-like domain n=1 Tax=Arcicella rosea TaxID=502909 RepID=A0A841EMU0_9BACT|nr:ABC transporter permease [Arcicella rosea]MBB6005427.1 membrane protein YdbS with pleckstrin-like domain [Arcicella rosea]
MKEYFALQYRMINRRFKDAGFEPILVYLILTVGFVGLSIYLFSKTEFAEYIFLLSALTLIGKLSETRRTEFLKICFGDRQLKKIRITENLICSIPFLAFLLYKQLFIHVGLLLTLTTFLALVNFRTTFNFTIWTPFSKKPFEFTTGFRNTFFLIFVAYALTIIAVSVNNFNLGVFAMLLVFATTLSYYSKPENEYYVWTYNVKPKEFLFNKIITAIHFSSSLAFPIAIVISMFHPEYIGILSLFFLIGWGFLINVILSKYSAYPDEMNITQGILLALCIWFPPILVILIPYLFKKSENRLSSLLK